MAKQKKPQMRCWRSLKKGDSLRVSYKVKGMHCRSCEIILEDEIGKIPGVQTVKASLKNNSVEVTSNGDVATKVKRAIRVTGYKLTTDSSENEGVANKNRWPDLLISALLVSVLVYFFRSINISNLLNPASFASSNLAAIFTIGLTAGVSSCMALVGGLVLGISTRFAEKHPTSTAFQKFRPHLFFNLGRLLSFFILGGLLGEAGSFFRLSGPLLGALIVMVGVVMFLLGVQLSEIFPRLSALTLPKDFSGFRARKDKEYSNLNSLVLGALTFFLPCGFTQAAQLYAISTGSFFQGGLVMFFFALGTAPGLLGIGGLAALIKKGRAAGVLFKAIGIIIILLALYNISNGLNLLNIRLPKLQTPSTQSPARANQVGPRNSTEQKAADTGKLEAGVRVLRSNYRPIRNGSQFVINPRDFVVSVNQPVRLEVLAEEDGEGCMGSITLPGLVNDFRIFNKGETAVFEFVPAMVGEYQITCAMGIPMGTITVTGN